jgi:chemotaxis protein CheY-P-specific phosphatase CheC
MTDATTALSLVATSTFESLAFLVAYEAALGDEAVPVLEARVAFAGAMEGALVLRASPQVAARVASNMLGLREKASPHLESDALGEVANVICGHLLPVLAGREELFRIQAPVVAAPAVSSVEPTASAALWLCGGIAEIELYVESPAA